MNILITGATGNVGSAILKYFSPQKGQKLYVASRNPRPENQNELFFDFENLSKTAQSLEGIDVVFLLRPPQLSNTEKYFKPLIKLCKEKAVKHLIFLSVQGAEKVSFIPHAKIEKLIIKSGLAYTFIRPSYFMQNLVTTFREDIQRENQIFLPAHCAQFLWVDVEDIGKAIAKILQNPDLHSFEAYTITGSDFFDFFEVAQMLSQTLRRNITFSNPNVLYFFFRLWQKGSPIHYILVLILLHFLPRFQKKPAISLDFENLTGEKPRKLSDFIQANAQVWKS